MKMITNYKKAALKAADGADMKDMAGSGMAAMIDCIDMVIITSNVVDCSSL